MEITAAIVLFFVLTILGVAFRKNKVDSNTLQDWANIVTISSVVSAVIVGIIFGVLYLIGSPPRPIVTPTLPNPATMTPTLSLIEIPSASSTPTLGASIINTEIPTLSPTPSDEEQRINRVNKYLICINDHNRELETCWTDLPEEYQTQYNTYHNGAGLATFISKWRGYYLTYTMHYCQNISGTHYVDAVIDKRDLSTQITTSEIGEFFFGINDKGWYIKNINFLPGETELSSDCDKEPITPTP